MNAFRVPNTASVILGIGILTGTFLAGCSGEQAPEWQYYERGEWQPGYSWTFESGDTQLEVTTLKLVHDLGESYLMSWQQNDQPFQRLISVDADYLGRHEGWAYPLEISCKLAYCKEHPPIYYPGQMAGRFELLPQKVTISPEKMDVVELGFVKQWE